MKPLSYLEKTQRPYSLLYDPQTGRAAAYTSNHQLIVEEATEKLVQYALAHQQNEKAFDPAMQAEGAPRWRPLPAWATPDTHGRLKLIWLQRPDGDAPDEEWRAIPPR
ncbi:MAG: hypothetical protein M0Q87_06245 [Ottowia sp.]|nr:hypothetical protein [Ottowia sp.]